ncbi:hypothetical protein Pint_31046 [Pistacia integerrima]|uniref:Uncharacterized protein n=1 Tax=Pistacia integerrima TaxID=434235 RepID=A0ACC0XRH6_9ROSI|nr:hypothetical protein Pint_31046 [Pistacia integerrima]
MLTALERWQSQVQFCNFCNDSSCYNGFIFCLEGGADEGEDLRNAAIRELREESGVISTEFLAEVCLDNAFYI